MRRIHFIILLCSCMFFTIVGRSQASLPDKISLATYISKAERETNSMRDSLNLSVQQVAQVDSVNKEFMKSIALLEGQTIPASERKLKMGEYKAKRDNDLAEILSAQQFQRYHELVKSQEDRMKARLLTN